ncbi:hypothetical protein HDU97_000082 [Phlyctochytrium planicorne]|nr:hypothetical protein HDU97_000082 [Phlyctochytrium planicorne]
MEGGMEKTQSSHSLQESIGNDASSKRSSTVAEHQPTEAAEATEEELLLLQQQQHQQLSPEITEDDESQAAQEKAISYLDQHEIEFQEQQEKRRKALEQQLLDKTKIPESYYTLSKKEELVLKYVENFNRQYVQLYPGRKELFLCPANEFGIKKFVCTTLRPTQLPFKELYDYRSCANFVSDYLSYELLDPPHELVYKLCEKEANGHLQPSGLKSPTGFGYDAYVVSGYATRDITIMDETRTDSDTVGIKSPYANGDTKEKDSKGAPSDALKLSNGKYKVKPPRQLRSMFLLKQEEKKKLQEQKEQELYRLELERQRALMNEDDDELKGLRIHAWVLVLPGKREVAEAFFIEPSTGKIFPTDNDNYLGVESVFSSTNYWVNMQVCYDGLKGIQFDLGDNSKWEFVLLDNTQPGVSSKNTENLQENDVSSEDEDEEENTSEILDLPPSWVDKIAITREQFESRCPSGSKIIVYKNARHEIFADYHRTDGMVSRITFFADDLKGFYGEIREKFKNRRIRDKLVERIRVPHLGKIQELFDPGRPHGLKEHVMIDGETTELHFYPSARSDGLVKRVEGDSKHDKVMEHFVEREDRLIYRSVTFEKSDDIPARDRSNAIKMTEKFDRNPEQKDLPTCEDPAKKVYFLASDRIRVIYHLEDGRIIPSSREFKKPTADQKTSLLEMPYSFEVNPYAKPPKKQHLYAQLCSLLKSEQSCIQAIKNSERELREILQARQSEEKEVALTISVYDTIRNNTVKISSDSSNLLQRLPNEEEKDAHKGDEEESKITNLDFLSPFLVNYQNQNALTREEAVSVKDSCLKSLKERLIEKANIIQGRLEEVTAEYQRRQLAYSRNADSMTVEETDEYVRFCNEALFKIHILEKRLAKHKENAPEKYIELDAKLKSDSRLATAFQATR